MDAYVTFSPEYEKAANLFHEAEADRNSGLIEQAKSKLRQVQSELADCKDVRAKPLIAKAENLLSELS